MAGSLAPLLAVASVARDAGEPLASDRSRAGRREVDSCAGNICGGLAQYAVDPGLHFYAEFDVPGEQEAPIDGSVTDYIYFNIFFGNSPSGRMNQFVPQLMLGEALTSSTGPPLYKAQWTLERSWIFGAQYFFSVQNPVTQQQESHAATGQLFNTSQGEVLWTSFELSDSWIWTLAMGVKGDAGRTSTVTATEPYMGILSGETSSWKESHYSKTNINSCWELDGMRDRQHYPSTGSSYIMQIRSEQPDAIEWYTAWHEFETPTCPGHPTSTVHETHNSTLQTVTWKIEFPDGDELLV